MIAQPSIVIIDYGVGNTHSVANAIEHLGYKKLRISDSPEEIRKADGLILPGVGAFEEAINNIKSKNLLNVLNEVVLADEKPILGICVGMQLLASFSEENGIHEGLNWIEGRVKKLDLSPGFSVPHVGWNDLIVKEDKLFDRNKDRSDFYFDHSYYFECDEQYVIGYCDYDIKVTAAVRKNNIAGVQFHPEKSHNNGLRMFRSFINNLY